MPAAFEESEIYKKSPDSASESASFISLNYLTPKDKRKRPALITAMGVLSLIVGCGGIFWGLFLEVAQLTGPWLPPDAPQPINLTIPFKIEFYLSWAAAIWLLIAGICVFTCNGRSSLGPRRMHIVYVVVKLILAGSYVALIIANDLDTMSGSAGSGYLVKDALPWLLIAAGYPILLIPVLRSKSVRDFCRPQRLRDEKIIAEKIHTRENPRKI